MDTVAEIGRNPVSKHQIQPEHGDEQVDAGRDCRTRLSRPNSQARTGAGKYSFSPVQLTTSRIGNLIRLILTFAICDDHTYIWLLHSTFPRRFSALETYNHTLALVHTHTQREKKKECARDYCRHIHFVFELAIIVVTSHM